LVYWRLAAPVVRRRWQGRVDDLPRDHVDRCWCGGELDDLHWHASYGRCRNCGCYVNRRPPAPEALAQLYSLDFYWHGRVGSKGQPPIEKRAESDRQEGRVDSWIDLIQRHRNELGTVLEAGPGSGVLLAELQRRGYTCFGVEPDAATAEFVSRDQGIDVRAGIFPHVEGLPTCDVFLAFDVIEHARDPLAFLQGAADLLRPGGIAILQTPIDRYPELEPPFGSKFDTAFDDVEHCFLFTDRAMELLAARTGLRIKDASQRLWLHHEICVFDKPGSMQDTDVRDSLA
jgi:SAM-dependent methyltransferase